MRSCGRADRRVLLLGGLLYLLLGLAELLLDILLCAGRKRCERGAGLVLASGSELRTLASNAGCARDGSPEVLPEGLEVLSEVVHAGCL